MHAGITGRAAATIMTMRPRSRRMQRSRVRNRNRDRICVRHRDHAPSPPPLPLLHFLVRLLRLTPLLSRPHPHQRIITTLDLYICITPIINLDHLRSSYKGNSAFRIRKIHLIITLPNNTFFRAIIYHTPFLLTNTTNINSSTPL
jgi:hypothetical protein